MSHPDDHLARAAQLLEAGASDPLKAVRTQAHALQLVRQAQTQHDSRAASAANGDRMAALLERLDYVAREAMERSGSTLAALGCTHIIRVPDVPPVLVGAESPQLKVDWLGGKGVLRSLFAGTLDGAPGSLSRISVRISINGSDDLFSTGSAPAYVPLRVFQPGTHAWFRLADYPVTPAQKWVVQFFYEGSGGPPSITPFLLFGYSRERS